MNDKIRELKALIENLDKDSPLRMQLEAALQDELKRQNKLSELEQMNRDMEQELKELEKMSLELEEMANSVDEKGEDPDNGNYDRKATSATDITADDLEEADSDDDDDEVDNRRKSGSSTSSDDSESNGKSGSAGRVLGELGDKFGNLLNNDEFVTASAGFVLGAAAVGLGVLAYSVIKK